MSDKWISVEDVKFLLSFCPEGETPKGLDPMFYFSLTYEGDKEIEKRLIRIRNLLPEPPSE